MYQFVTGPLAWLSFTIFLAGSIYRVVWYVRGLDWKMDRVTYRANIKYGLKGALRSVLFWLVPFGTRSWRVKPGMTILFFVFHLSLLGVPLFLSAHNLLLKERFGFHLPMMPDMLADGLTVALIITAFFLLLRRVALPEVRILTDGHDLLALLIAVAPFITGLLAFHQVGDYNFWLITHIISGEIFLAAIPLTKLSHALLFFLSRIQLGMDFGIKRGGMKSKGLAW